jgi:adenosylcobinamide kinase / adenosylcobinamide-phosphate guanylyltransferase
MPEGLTMARSELILGGQKSGKSRRAEQLASAWLAQSPLHRAVLIATAHAGDDEMRERIARHQRDRAARVSALLTIEEPLALAEAITRHGNTQTLVLVDCLTLWLTNYLFPDASSADLESNRPLAVELPAQAALILIAVKNSSGPIVLVTNEIGLGVIPMGRPTREFVDTLGRLNQDVAQICERVTFMAAGLPLTLKGQP